jgi:hypothetical protein
MTDDSAVILKDHAIEQQQYAYDSFLVTLTVHHRIPSDFPNQNLHLFLVVVRVQEMREHHLAESLNQAYQNQI